MVDFVADIQRFSEREREEVKCTQIVYLRIKLLKKKKNFRRFGFLYFVFPIIPLCLCL